MEFFLSRYRNLTVLLIAIAAQLLLIAYQVKSNKDVALIRVWAVTAVTPVEQGLEFIRRYTWGFVDDYFVLLGVRSENEKLKHENGQLKIENHYLKSELATSDRARLLSVFQSHSPSKMVAARVIGNGTGANSKVVFIDRGSTSGVESGMAVVTPDGIVGKVVDSYPTASLVMLLNDPTFAAGVVSEKNHVRGTLRGLGHAECLVDFVQNEEKVDIGEWFFTSGDDRIFPRGFPVGQVRVARNGKTFKEIYVTPAGLQGGVEEVLVMLQGVHQEIPDGQSASNGYKILPSPGDKPPDAPQAASQTPALSTDADRLREQYKEAGQAQGHVFGEGLPGSTPPDFTKIQGIRGTGSGASAQPGTAAKQPAPTAPPGAAPAQKSAAANPNAASPAKPPQATKPGGGQVQADAVTPSARPKPRGPLLITDPTDTDPGGEHTPPPKTDKPPAKQTAPKLPNVNP